MIVMLIRAHSFFFAYGAGNTLQLMYRDLWVARIGVPNYKLLSLAPIPASRSAAPSSQFINNNRKHQQNGTGERSERMGQGPGSKFIIVMPVRDRRGDGASDETLLILIIAGSRII